MSSSDQLRKYLETKNPDDLGNNGINCLLIPKDKFDISQLHVLGDGEFGKWLIYGDGTWNASQLYLLSEDEKLEKVGNFNALFNYISPGMKSEAGSIVIGNEEFVKKQVALIDSIILDLRKNDIHDIVSIENVLAPHIEKILDQSFLETIMYACYGQEAFYFELSGVDVFVINAQQLIAGLTTAFITYTKTIWKSGRNSALFFTIYLKSYQYLQQNQFHIYLITFFKF